MKIIFNLANYSTDLFQIFIKYEKKLSIVALVPSLEDVVPVRRIDNLKKKRRLKAIIYRTR